MKININYRMGCMVTGCALLAILVTGGCKKYGKYPVSFNVTASQTTIKAGDTVIFTIAGDPDFITFYSGEIGFNYQNANRMTLLGTPTLEFSTYKPNGTQPNSLSVLLSTNFNGLGDTVNIAKASWTDITSQVTLSTGADNTYSGKINLENAILGPGKNLDTALYVAFKYNVVDTVGQPTWDLRSFYIRNTLDTFVNQVSGITDAGWLSVAFQNTIQWAGLTTAPSITPNNMTHLATTTWLVTKPLKVYYITRDYGVGIKTLSDLVLTKYMYVYKKAGTYNAVFKASNTTVAANDSQIRQITITVQ